MVSCSAPISDKVILITNDYPDVATAAFLVSLRSSYSFRLNPAVETKRRMVPSWFPCQIARLETCDSTNGCTLQAYQRWCDFRKVGFLILFFLPCFHH